MKHRLIYILIFSTLYFVSCNNKEQKNAYNPNRTEEEIDAGRREAIEQKRMEYQENKLTDTQMYYISDSLQTIKISVYIPDTDEIPTTEQKVLENKLVQMLTINGVGGIGGSPRFILTPEITQTKQDITNTAPTMYSNTYSTTLYLADALNGDVFASTSIDLKGVGQSPLKAFLNAFVSLNPKDVQFAFFVKQGKQSIVYYYNSNCSNLIAEAEKFANQNDYNLALTILNSMPSNVDCYSDVLTKTNDYFQKLIDKDCEIILSKMKAELGKSNDPSASGFNGPAMNYYSMINHSSKCYSEAEKIYNNYISKLNPQAKRDWEQSLVEYKDNLENKKQEWEFKKQEAELKAKMAIEGNGELLDIYRKQYNYEKLPWIRKWIHLGNYDPFDGTR